MVIYKCDRCNKIFSHKGDFNRHTNRKNLCSKASHNESLESHKKILKKDITHTKEKLPESLEIIDIHEKSNRQCIYCNKVFANISNCYRHQKEYCKERKKIEDGKEIIFKNLLERLDKIESDNKTITQENKFLKSQISNTTNINNNSTIKDNTIQNNIYNNIKIVAYGKEDMSKITKREWKNLLCKRYRSIEELTDMVHFSKNKPENHNIYIPNIKSRYIMVYDGKKWNLKDRTNVLDDLYDEKAYIIFDKFDELKSELTFHIVNKFNEIKNEYDKEEIKSVLMKDIELLLYNKRNIPILTKRKIDNLLE